MPLPSPVAQFPDMSALVQQNQARSASLINAGWMQAQGAQAERQAQEAQARSYAEDAARRAENYEASSYARGLSEWDEQGNPRPSDAWKGTKSSKDSATDAAYPVSHTGPMAAFLPLLDKHEGGGRYDTLFGHSQREGGRFAGVDVSNMTLGQLRQFTNVNGEYGQWVKGQVGRVATPMGRHQIVGTTLFNSAKALGLTDDTVFSPQVQDQIAAHLARQRLAASSSMSGKIAGLRAEWEGFKHVDDSALAAAIQQFEASA